ncbi:hypothetical protein HQ560_11420 [bacterium]|nr:hypothetical protein [bacterium]
MSDTASVVDPKELSAGIEALKAELGKSIIGQHKVMDSVITTLLCGTPSACTARVEWI